MVASKNKAALDKESAAGKKFGIVVSRYHEELTEAMLEGALKTLEGLGARKDQISTVWVPGSFEIPLAARAFAQQEMDAIVCLGVIIKGETTHHEFIAREVARGISQIALSSGTPVIFGVLTTQSLEQAKARCGGDKGNKGVEAAEAAVSMIQILEDIKKSGEKQSKSVGFGHF